MIEHLVEIAQSLPLWAILVSVFVATFIEHLVPPSPSDVFLAFVGTLVGIGTLGFGTTLVVATAGSTGGFIVAYTLGRKYGRTLLEHRWVPFVTPSMIDRVNHWFDRYHGLIIVSNRFLAGTRAVIAFAAGMARLPVPRTVVYSTLSAFAWNALLLWAGMLLGSRWKDIDQWLSLYGWIILGVVVVGLGVWFIQQRHRRHKAADHERHNEL